MNPYPTELFDYASTALFLFGAGFGGQNDAVHGREAGVIGDVVDTDTKRLELMRLHYPWSWRFHNADAFEFAAAATETWDVVSIDPFTGDAADRVLDEITTFVSLARHGITITLPKRKRPRQPKGWKASVFPRSDTADWLVLTR